MRAAQAKSWETLKENHLRDYTGYFNRVTLRLGEGTEEDLPTDRRLDRYRQGFLTPGWRPCIFNTGVIF